MGPDILTMHLSTIRPNTEIRAEAGCGGPYFVRVYTAGSVTYTETCVSPARARERFERIVDEHYAADESAPPIAGAADPERESKLDAERVTWEFATKSTRKLDTGRRPIDESPLFGGERQQSLF